jgi:hypothetical protein
VRVYIQTQLARMGVDIFAFEDVPPRIYRWGMSGWQVEEYDERSRGLEPTLSMPREMLEEIVRAAEGHVHAQDATVRHLDDAIAVRDRLLTLVEQPRIVTPRQA